MITHYQGLKCSWVVSGQRRGTLICLVYNTSSLVYSFSERNSRILQINKGVVSEQCSSGAETAAATYLFPSCGHVRLSYFRYDIE